MLDIQGDDMQKLMINVLCPVREKLVPLVPADLRAHRDLVERLVPQDLPDLPEHRFVVIILIDLIRDLLIRQ